MPGAVDSGVGTGGTVAAAAGVPSRPCMQSTISPSVRSEAMVEASTSGMPGASSCTAARISTRLIESIPRSPSRSMSRSSISAG